MNDHANPQPELEPFEPADAGREAADGAPATGEAADAARIDYVARLVAARCPELGEAEVDGAAAGSSRGAGSVRPVTMLPVEVGERILDALTGLDQRMDAIERLVGGRA